jgi:hypothetical protein
VSDDDLGIALLLTVNNAVCIGLGWLIAAMLL